MTPRYWLLILAVVAVTAAVVVLGRGSSGPSPERASGAAQGVDIAAIVIEDNGVRPDRTVIPKGSRVLLTVRHAGTKPVSLALGGYEDRVFFEALAPGDTASVSFLADRPGADFAWIVNGVPTGRFAVAGSHLEEGHE